MIALPVVLFLLAASPHPTPQRCEPGRPQACKALALAYEKGDGVRRDVARAAEFEVLARQDEKPRPTPVCVHCDACNGREACQHLCETHADDPLACFLSAQRAYEERDLTTAARFGALACKKGIGPGCTLAGTLAMGTMGLPKDTARAEQLLNRGCELDEAAACGTAGLLYVSGQLFTKDELRGARMLGKSCAEGYSPGCATLGQAYENGEGVPQDEMRAVQLYELGCNGGPRHVPSAHACFQVADLYDKGKWIPGDRAKALEFYEKGCKAHSEKACHRLGELQNEGRAP